MFKRVFTLHVLFKMLMQCFSELLYSSVHSDRFCKYHLNVKQKHLSPQKRPTSSLAHGLSTKNCSLFLGYHSYKQMTSIAQGTSFVPTVLLRNSAVIHPSFWDKNYRLKTWHITEELPVENENDIVKLKDLCLYFAISEVWQKKRGASQGKRK